MIIKTLSAFGFRNLHTESVPLIHGINILHGANAQGKTNFIESIYFASLGRSLRGVHDVELIGFNEKLAAVSVEIFNDFTGSDLKIDAYIQRELTKAKKSVCLNNVPIRHMKDLFGELLLVVFTPDDLRLVKSGPAERRRFMDMEICQLSGVYYGDLREYYRVLRQRNALLKMIKNDTKQMDLLSVYDEQLAIYGVKIMMAREKFIMQLSEIANHIHHEITNGLEHLMLAYTPDIRHSAKSGKLVFESVSHLKQIYQDILKKSQKNDIVRGSTSHGIHKDDVDFVLNKVSLKLFGSQGQMRTAALSAKLAEAEIIKEHTRNNPVLLLDDVFSELDASRQKFLLKKIESIQTIITCTGIEDILRVTKPDHAHIMQVKNGTIETK